MYIDKKEKYDSICSFMQLFILQQEVIKDTAIKDAYVGTQYLIDEQKLNAINKKMIDQFEKTINLFIHQFEVGQVKMIKDHFKFLRKEIDIKALFDYTNKDESYFNPGAKKVS